MNVPEGVYGLYVPTVRKQFFSQKIYYLMHPPNPFPIKIFDVMHKCWPNYLLIWYLSNRQWLIDLIWRDSNQGDSSWCWFHSNWRDSILKNFRAQLFQLQNYSRAQKFFYEVSSRVFTFNFLWAMPQCAPVGNIQHPSDGVGDVKGPLPSPGNLWAYASSGYWWAHTNAFISISP